jgi:tetratricopeptide (TPR) repeat protein
MVFLFLTGCAGPREDTRTGTVPTRPDTSGIEAGTELDEASDSPYFYFAEAELQWKKGNLDEAAASLKRALELDPESIYIRRELATLYLQRKDAAGALAVIESILEREPKDVGALTIFGQIKLSQKKIAEARTAYETLLSVDPGEEKVYLILGGIYREEKEIDKALSIYSRLVETIPGSYAGHYYLGRIYLEKDRPDDAEKEFLTTIRLAPDLEEPRFALIGLYREAGEEEKILGLYQEILDIDPENVRAAMAVGLLYHRQGRAEEGDSLLKSLGERSRSEKQVLAAVVQEYLDRKAYADAVVVLEGMLRGAPENSGIDYLLGIAFDGLKEPEKAIASFRKVPTDSKFFENAVIHIAFLYQDGNRIDEAIQFLNGVVEAVPDNPEFLLHLGTFYETKEAYGKAESVLRKGLALDPENVRLHFRMGVVYDKWGRKEDSIGQMKKVIQLDPKHANALNYLGYTYADLGRNLDEAETLIKRALEFKPNDGYITDSLGWVYYKKGLYKQALEYLEKAVGLVSDDPVILEHLGDAYLKVGDKTKALDFYRRSLEHREKDREAIQDKIRQLVGQDS